MSIEEEKVFSYTSTDPRAEGKALIMINVDSEAEASLYRAAPELLAALGDLLDAYDMADDHERTILHTWKAFKDARAAINAAREAK